MLKSGSRWQKTDWHWKSDQQLLQSIWRTENWTFHLETSTKETGFGFGSGRFSVETFLISADATVCLKPDLQVTWDQMKVKNHCRSFQVIHVNSVTKRVTLPQVWEAIWEWTGLISTPTAVLLLVIYATDLVEVKLEEPHAFLRMLFVGLRRLPSVKKWESVPIYIYIYIYVCVCVCVCVNERTNVMRQDGIYSNYFLVILNRFWPWVNKEKAFLTLLKTLRVF